MLQTERLTIGRAGTALAALADVALGDGEAALILGPSGSGKSTALFTLAGLLAPIQGVIRLDGDAITDLSRTQRTRLRGHKIGVVFQDMHLLSGLSALDNLLLAPFASGARQDRQGALQGLADLGLTHLAHRQAETLSRGEAQRVAVTRAMLMRPRLILADEPTASLDDDNAAQVANLLLDAAARTEASLVIATHDQRLKALIPNRLALRPANLEVAA